MVEWRQTTTIYVLAVTSTAAITTTAVYNDVWWRLVIPFKVTRSHIKGANINEWNTNQITVASDSALPQPLLFITADFSAVDSSRCVVVSRTSAHRLIVSHRLTFNLYVRPGLEVVVPVRWSLLVVAINREQLERFFDVLTMQLSQEHEEMQCELMNAFCWFNETRYTSCCPTNTERSTDMSDRVERIRGPIYCEPRSWVLWRAIPWMMMMMMMKMNSYKSP